MKAGLKEQDIDWLIASKDRADYFEDCMKLIDLVCARELCNFLKREVTHLLKAKGMTMAEFKEEVPPVNMLVILWFQMMKLATREGNGSNTRREEADS